MHALRRHSEHSYEYRQLPCLVDYLLPIAVVLWCIFGLLQVGKSSAERGFVAECDEHQVIPANG